MVDILCILIARAAFIFGIVAVVEFQGKQTHEVGLSVPAGWVIGHVGVRAGSCPGVAGTSKHYHLEFLEFVERVRNAVALRIATNLVASKLLSCGLSLRLGRKQPGLVPLGRNLLCSFL